MLFGIWYLPCYLVFGIWYLPSNPSDQGSLGGTPLLPSLISPDDRLIMFAAYDQNGENYDDEDPANVGNNHDDGWIMFTVYDHDGENDDDDEEDEDFANVGNNHETQFTICI